MVGSAGLLAMHFDGERIDIDGAALHFVAASAGPLVTTDPSRQRLAQYLPIELARQPFDQPPV